MSTDAPASVATVADSKAATGAPVSGEEEAVPDVGADVSVPSAVGRTSETTGTEAPTPEGVGEAAPPEAANAGALIPEAMQTAPDTGADAPPMGEEGHTVSENHPGAEHQVVVPDQNPHPETE